MNETMRPTRLRATPRVRALVRETRVGAQSLIYPLFLIEERDTKREIPSLPGQYHHSPDRVWEAVEESLDHGVDKFLLFGVPKEKDEAGSGAWNPQGVVQSGLRTIRERYPDVLLLTDVCLCEYTSHGHCGVLRGNGISTGETLPLLAKTAVSHIRAGADIVAPSSMADGQVGAIRAELDAQGLQGAGIMSYSAKYASAFYGPFRAAAGSTPAFGDRKGYQMDPHNWREAQRECALDEAEGADYLMVKPALSYLDVIHRVHRQTRLPLAAYSVSGEYAMLKAAAAAGLVEEYAALCETAVSIYRAGADILISYYAKEIAAAMRKGDIG